MNFKNLLNKYGSPLYVYDFDYMKQEYQKLKEAFSGRKSIIAYAVKSNSNLSVIKNFAELESGADCVSIGEVKRALKAGVKPYRTIFSGVGKRDDEIKEAITLGILFINVESFRFIIVLYEDTNDIEAVKTFIKELFPLKKTSLYIPKRVTIIHSQWCYMILPILLSILMILKHF
jgi:diaminopimelate decarboxylase